MAKGNNVKIKIFSGLVLTVLLLGVMIPLTQAENNTKNKIGFDKGPSYTNVVPLKKTALINFDKNTMIDDYAYLASIPTSIFNHDGTLYSYPLLYYDDEYEWREEKERTLNPRQGLDYFMDDWMEVCNGQLDEMITVNVPKSKVSHWKADEYVEIQGDNPYDIAADIALHDFSYSDDAVVAVVEEDYENPNIVTKNKLTGTLESSEVERKNFKMTRPVIGTGATYETFEIKDSAHKYILTQMSWKGKEDYDLQLYDPELGMVETAFNSYSSPYPFTELVGSYIFNHGDWEVSVSAQAKKTAGDSEGKMESMSYYTTPEPKGLSSMLNTNTVDIDIALLPGVTVPLDSTPYGCRDIELTLEPEDPNVDLGFTVIDPTGTEIASSFAVGEAATKCLNMKTTSESDDSDIKINLEKFGETIEGESYKVCVFSIGDLSRDIDFTVEYSWSQNFTRQEGDQIESAANGAVLASNLNAPMLYTESDKLNSRTRDVLYKLGVKNIYVVNLGDYLSKDAKNELKNIADVKEMYTDAKKIYDDIRDNTGENDVIFSTIEPYDYWYVANDLEGTGRAPAGQWDGAYHFGQAAYIAAHHGSPVIIVDNHPKLSQAITWATDWWIINAYNRFNLPSAGAMTLTAKRAYEFLEEYEFGKVEIGGAAKQDHEVIITVAGQFDIGIPWDRSFTGAGLNGRFWGHPVDSAYAICRNVFYPALIFVNPAMDEITLTQGSESTTKGIGDNLLNTNLGLGNRLSNPLGQSLKITKPITEEKFEYPVLQTYATYGYRYNEEKWKHFNCKYTRADGIIPYETPSPDKIDEGVAHGKTSAYYPDMSESEVIPFYSEKAGYDNVYSTSFDYITDNLNKGVILWVSQIHGHHGDGGNLELWSPNNPYTFEENPWRAYEPIAMKAGNLDEFILWLFYHGYHTAENALDMDIPILHTLGTKLPRLPEIFPDRGSTENPDVAFLNPQLTTLGRKTKLLMTLGMFDVWGAFPFMIYRDRILHPLETIEEGLPFVNWADGDGKVCHSPPTGGRLVGKQIFGADFDDAFENIHSVGINSISCLPAHTYLHMTWMRHGSVYQIIDPWTTTDWAGIWNQMLIKRFAMGYTVGEAYERGLRAVGPLYSCGQSWWDLWENVVYTGDPNLRVFVPNTEYTDTQNGYEENHWTQEETRPLMYDAELNFNGHTPFGATNYPHEREPETFMNTYLWLIVILALIIIILVAMFIPKRKK
jgi:hypothetical protein